MIILAKALKTLSDTVEVMDKSYQMKRKTEDLDLDEHHESKTRVWPTRMQNLK